MVIISLQVLLETSTNPDRERKPAMAYREISVPRLRSTDASVLGLHRFQTLFLETSRLFLSTRVGSTRSLK